MFNRTLSSLRDWREYLTPVTHISSFRKTGEITPEEFIQAGDYLVYKFPTWSWASAPTSKQRDFLPPDKQVLVTRHVPSHVRASAYSGFDEQETTEDGWVATSRAATSSSINRHIASDNSAGLNSDSIDESDDGITEITDLEETDLEDDDDQGVYRMEGRERPTRTYNLFITYSTSYRVPKFYLSGFDADGTPLKPQDMFEDIVGDYKDKTVTIEKAPFQDDLTSISIHPCRHAQVMRLLLDRAETRLRRQQNVESLEVTDGVAKLGLNSDSSGAAADGWEDIGDHENLPSAEDVSVRVDQYLIIFLKFIASVTPGIEHDFTMAM